MLFIGNKEVGAGQAMSLPGPLLLRYHLYAEPDPWEGGAEQVQGGELGNGTQGSPNPSEQGLVQDGAQGWQGVGEKAAPRPGRDTTEH